MTDEARKRRSKWDTKEGSHDIVEVSEDESPPMNTDDHRKGGALLPHQDLTNGNGKQLGESSSLKPDAFMHQGSAGNKHERTDGFNKDMKERQSKASSEKSQPPRMADEGHNKDDWGKLASEKAVGNQGMSRYADDRRRGDGWGTALSRGYTSRVSSDPDPWRQRSPSPSPIGAWNRSRRNRSGSRSRSRSRERGRGRSRSRSPYFADRGSEWRVDRGRVSGGPSLLCRDFTAGRCRRGTHCRFPHEDGGRRQLDEHYPADSRERYGHQNKELMDSREPNDYSRSRQSRGHYEEGTWERSEPRRDYRSTGQCYEFVKGRCNRGASCRYAHDDSASHVGWRDEVRESAHGRGGPDSSFGSRTEHRRANRNPCKFFAEGRCRRGESCPYLHEEALQSQMGLGRPDEPLNYSDGRTTAGNYSNWGEKTNAPHASSNILSRDDRENPGSQGTGRSVQMGSGRPDEPLNYSDGRITGGNYPNWGEQTNGSHASSNIASRDDKDNPGSQGTGRSDSQYEYKNRQLQDARRNQYQLISQEDFGSQGQIKPEIAASQPQQFLIPTHTNVDSMNSDKVSGTVGQSASASTGNLGAQTGIHAASLMVGQNMGQTARSQDAISHIPGPPPLPATSQLPNTTPMSPFNSQLQHSNFSVHQNKQAHFAVSQAAASNSAPTMQNHPGTPYMGHNQQAYSLGAQELPDLSALSGQNFGAAGQAPQNLPTTGHAGQNQATIDITKRSQDSGTQSLQNIHNFQPVAPNVQPQPLQGLSVVPSSSSADMVGAPVPQNAATLTASLAQFLMPGLTAGTIGLQGQPNLNPSLMIPSSAAPPAVQPNPWPWAQQQSGVPQLSHPVPSEQQAPLAHQVPMVAGSSNGNAVLLPHSVVPTTSHAATPTAVVNEPTTPSGNKKVVNESTTPSANKKVVTESTTPSANKKGEEKDADGEAPEDGENKKGKESKALKMFKLALADFVKDALKPTWKEGQLTRDIHKTIVKKVVDKVTSTVENTPQTKEKIEIYMNYSKDKLSKLVQAYVGKYVKASS